MSPRKRRPRQAGRGRPGQPPEVPPDGSRGRPGRATILAALLLLAAGTSAIAWYLHHRAGAAPGEYAPPSAGESERPPAEFVGAAACAACHQKEHAEWQESQHALAMQEANAESVLGNFDNARFAYGDVVSTFFRRDDGFWVRTDGPDGRMTDFEVKYTFGIYPLQQYLIEFADGRLQPLSISWDSRPEEQGGQRWFHLYPGEGIEHTDELHWTGLQQNWNFMCADCHSTNVQKGYDPQTNRFHTTWSEINVSCEACHGPGSGHVEWAGGAGSGRAPAWENKGLTAALTERKGVRWTTDPATGAPQRSRPRATDREIEVCAQCHSRRAQVAEGYVAGAPFLDHYIPSLLMPGLYHPDGQQLDEVYTYGSFLQSRMFHQGVTCSDCHNPHTQKLRAPGNQVCGQCHSTAKYDAPAHHFHPAGSSGAKCTSCHMPTTTYMQVDPRHDHAFQIPRPALSVELGVPNACTSCHTHRTAGWAAAKVEGWYGGQPTGFQRFADEFHADEHRRAGADSALLAVASDPSHPSIVRASALARLGEGTRVMVMEAARVGLARPHPLERRAALAVLEALPPEQRIRLAAPFLNDSSRVVRLEAAWILAPAARSLPLAQQAAFTRASNEFVASQLHHADRPENRVALGTFFAMTGRLAEAEAEFQAALRLFQRSVPAYVNLADLYRALGREAEAERILRQGLDVVPEEPSLHYALGLSLARSGQLPEAVAALARAATLGPQSPRYAYAHAVALHSSGRERMAIRTLEEALELHPGDRDLLFALATFHRDAGDLAAARHYAELLVKEHPTDADARALSASLGDGVRPRNR